MSARGERGQSAFEYMLLILLIAVVACAALSVANGGLLKLFGIVRKAVTSWLG